MKASDIVMGMSISFYNIHHPSKKYLQERSLSDRALHPKASQTQYKRKRSQSAKINLLQQPVYSKRKIQIKKRQFLDPHSYQSLNFQIVATEKLCKQAPMKTNDSMPNKQGRVHINKKSQNFNNAQSPQLCKQDDQQAGNAQGNKHLSIANIQFIGQTQNKNNVLLCLSKPKKNQSILKNFGDVQEKLKNNSNDIAFYKQSTHRKSSLHMLNIMKRQKVALAQRLRPHIGNDLQATKKMSMQQIPKQIKHYKYRCFGYQMNKKGKTADYLQLKRKKQFEQLIIAPW